LPEAGTSFSLLVAAPKGPLRIEGQTLRTFGHETHVDYLEQHNMRVISASGRQNRSGR